jgi:arylsulfatase A-like enzyme
MAGISLLPLLKGNKWKGHDVLFFEHEGNRAVRKGDWKIVSTYPENKWALYNMQKDRSELQDLSAEYPEKLAELSLLYDQWAARSNVLPFSELEKYDKKRRRN